MSNADLKDQGSFNQIQIGANVEVAGVISGSNNKIIIGDSVRPSTIRINLNGDGNNIIIRSPLYIHNLAIKVGNHIRAHNTELLIGDSVSMENGGIFYLYNSGNKCKIGKNCLISTGLVIRCGESPHLIFDKISGEYLDISEGVFIGDHVWIGERVYVTKRSSIANDSIVAACSVVTKRFIDSNVVIAGNPARVVRENIHWIRNHSHLESGSIYEESFLDFNKNFPLI